jgi:hypothetical protein
MATDRVAKILPIHRQQPAKLLGFHCRKPKREAFVELRDYN